MTQTRISFGLKKFGRKKLFILVQLQHTTGHIQTMSRRLVKSSNAAKKKTPEPQLDFMETLVNVANSADQSIDEAFLRCRKFSFVVLRVC